MWPLIRGQSSPLPMISEGPEKTGSGAQLPAARSFRSAECCSRSEKAWSGGPSPWECPAAPCPGKCPLQAPRLLSSILLSATRRGHLFSAGAGLPVPRSQVHTTHTPTRALLTASAPPALSPAGCHGGLPDNCQPEVWTLSPWWLPLFR